MKWPESLTQLVGRVSHWTGPAPHPANASCHFAGPSKGLQSLSSASGFGTHGGEAAQHRRGYEAIGKMKCAQALDPDLGSIIAPSLWANLCQVFQLSNRVL